MLLARDSNNDQPIELERDEQNEKYDRKYHPQPDLKLSQIQKP